MTVDNRSVGMTTDADQVNSARLYSGGRKVLKCCCPLQASIASVKGPPSSVLS